MAILKGQRYYKLKLSIDNNNYQEIKMITNLHNHIQAVHNQSIDIVEYTAKALEQAKAINKEYNYFTTISEELALSQAQNLKKTPTGRLAGVFLSVKDAICVQGVESTAGSKILKGYKPLFNATVIQRCINEGAIILGKTSQDEFGFGGFAVNTEIVPKNPFNKDRVTGGSSGGSAGITQKADFAHLALGESTGGSIVNPALFCGVYGLCPTYGRVSRYGLLDYGSSLDKIGPMAKTIEDIASLLNIIAGHDDKEATSATQKTEDYTKYLNRPVRKMKIGIIKDLFGDVFGDGVDENITKAIYKKIEQLESEEVICEEVSMPITNKYGIPAYYIIATAEASTNLAKYCGIRYGAADDLKSNYNEYFTKFREANFSKEAKRRIMLGTFTRMAGYRDAYYTKAMKVRTKIIEEYQHLFKKYDALISPVMPMLAPKFSELEKLTPAQHYMADIMTAPPNLAGLPHINVPIGMHNDQALGLMLTTNHFEEGKLIQIGSAIR
ncbi:Asp-tRNA(Asn)/Glu-tRNA(Gln) amidotransferase subunit GatA [Candidatus Woesearchaeota archaeon]|nr:Asp-tRNA(Asn)/Glu-tRNA(Gln) amidotransferase subunit GatA [Candidatus Woesearchaeota archaeon]